MIKALSEDDRLIIDGEEFLIKKVYSVSQYKTTYLVKSSVHHFFIKEILPFDSSMLSKIERDNKTKQAVFEKGFIPEKELSFHDSEILANEIGVQETDNNSSFLFPTWRLQTDLPQSAAVYLKVYSVAGHTFDYYLSDTEWRENKTEQDILSFVTDLATKTSEAVSHLHKKGLLHLDIKLQNLYHCEDGSVKLIDLGSSIPIELSERNNNVLIQSTFGYQSDLLIEITSEYMNLSKNREKLSKLIQGLSVKEDIFAIAMVIIYLLTGDEDETVLNLENDVLYSELISVLDEATFSQSITVGGQNFKTGSLTSSDDFTAKLKNYSDILNNNGLHEAVVLRQGIKHIQDLITERGLNIDEELIPDIDRKE